MTDAERKLWRGLRLRQLHGFKFRRQFPLGSYIVDFVCLEACLIVEADGGQHADEIYGDAERDAWLKSQNFRGLRYWNNQVLNELNAVMADIGSVLLATPPSQPSPVKGEGWDGGVSASRIKKARIAPGFFTTCYKTMLTSGNRILNWQSLHRLSCRLPQRSSSGPCLR